MQGPEGDKAIELALQNPDKYVLKNQAEGEGNVYHKDNCCHKDNPYGLYCENQD